MAVKQLLHNLALPFTAVELGMVELADSPTEAQLLQLKEGLQQLGFELLDDTRQRLIEKIKTTIITQVQQDLDERQYNFSHILSQTLQRDYSYLSHLFSEVEGITIEKYIINQKIEKAKELLVYDELSLSEIAFRLGYSSVAHLSAQFKKVTGLTPSHFKQRGGVHRKALDSI
jgi:AraC-like DNA-binding protein